MKKLVNALLIAACSLGLFSCEKDYPEIEFTLPAETQNGEHTFGFMLGDIVWTNYGQDCSRVCEENLEAKQSGDSINSFSLRNYFQLFAYKKIREKRETKLFQHFNLAINNLSKPGTYWLTDPFLYDGVSLYDELTGVNYTNNPLKKTFSITIINRDTVNKILAGRFEGVLYNAKNKSDSIIIKSGRFDVKLTE